MAQLSLGESRRRVFRRVLRKKRFPYADARSMARQDQQHFGWLVGHGLFTAAGDGVDEATDRGRAAAGLGLYES